MSFIDHFTEKEGDHMNKNAFSPHIRVAMLSTLTAPFTINDRVIFDYEMIFVTGGKCNIYVDGKCHLCKKNNIVFLRPGITHRFECVDNCNFIQPHIHFDISYSDDSEKRYVSFKRKSEMSTEELSLIQHDTLKDIPIPTVFTPYDINTFQRLFFEIIDLYQKKGYNYELTCKIKMLELINVVLTQFDINKSEKAEATHDLTIAVKEYIDGNYLSLITLESLSNQFYVNKYTLMRRFKSIYNQNVVSYYRSKRIEYIKSALRNTSLSITALSEKLGFSDVYSFSRFFKNYTGCSPTHYRNSSSDE